MLNLCSGEGEGFIAEWCLGEFLQDLPCSRSHYTQHGVVRGDITEGDGGREVAGNPSSHVGNMG